MRSPRKSNLSVFRAQLGIDELARAWEYVREAIDKYWSDGTFELTVNVGCATGRKIAEAG